MAGVDAENDVRTLEREAEALRARLHDTIAQIRDPDTLEHAKDEMKLRAAQAKEKIFVYMRDARDNALESGASFTRNLQKNAFENPLPVALIGAGLGWRFYKNPPVAAALIGVGLWSMMKTWDATRAMRGHSHSARIGLAGGDNHQPMADRAGPLPDAQHRNQIGLLLAFAGAGLLTGLLIRNSPAARPWLEGENMRMRAGTFAEKIAETIAGSSAQMQSQAHRREPVTT